jgi:hypothetical protein
MTRKNLAKSLGLVGEVGGIVTQQKFRTGFDLGTNSIGWAAIKLDELRNPCGPRAIDRGAADGGRLFTYRRKSSFFIISMRGDRFSLGVPLARSNSSIRAIVISEKHCAACRLFL